MPEDKPPNQAEFAPDFVYVIFIAADVDAVWNGLLDRELTKAYWGHYNESDWQPGSRWEHVRSDGSGKVNIVGRVVEIEPPNKLVVTWAFPADADEAHKNSQVTYELKALGPDTRLTITHSGLLADSDMWHGVTQGWPAVASNLKTLLETGRVMSEEDWGA